MKSTSAGLPPPVSTAPTAQSHIARKRSERLNRQHQKTLEEVKNKEMDDIFLKRMEINKSVSRIDNDKNTTHTRKRRMVIELNAKSNKSRNGRNERNNKKHKRNNTNTTFHPHPSFITTSTPSNSMCFDRLNYETPTASNITTHSNYNHNTFDDTSYYFRSALPPGIVGANYKANLRRNCTDTSSSSSSSSSSSHNVRNSKRSSSNNKIQKRTFSNRISRSNENNHREKRQRQEENAEKGAQVRGGKYGSPTKNAPSKRTLIIESYNSSSLRKTEDGSAALKLQACCNHMETNKVDILVMQQTWTCKNQQPYTITGFPGYTLVVHGYKESYGTDINGNKISAKRGVAILLNKQASTAWKNTDTPPVVDDEGRIMALHLEYQHGNHKDQYYIICGYAPQAIEKKKLQNIS